MKHLIIGAGAAGISAAKTIRELSKTDEIVIVSKDDSIHSRCMLHKLISGQRDEKALSFIPDGFFEEQGIDWLSGQGVTSIDTAGQRAYLEGGSIDYDRLLIASGAVSVIPPVGALRTAGNVYGLRHLSDARRIKAANVTDVAVIGAGLVGLDAAWGLLELGRTVTVVEMGERILPLNLNKRAAQPYLEKFQEHGCRFELSRRVMDTKCDDRGNVTGILLDNGEVISCGMVIAAAGVRPALGFLDGSGIIADRGIKVNDRLETSIGGVYAAGDVTGLSGIWPNAVIQGRTAALGMCGQQALYDDTYAMKNTLNFYGLNTLSLGQTEPDEGDMVYEREDKSGYRRVIISGGAVKGIIIQGDIGQSGFWQELIKRKIDISTKGSVWSLSYADFYETLENGEYTWAV